MLKSQNFLGRLDEAFGNRDPRTSPHGGASLSGNPASPAKPAAHAAATPAPPPAAAASPTSTAKNESTTGNRLIVGPDVKLKGAEILDCDTLVVEGRVEATMDSHIIRIAEQGSFCGTVGIDTAEIHGHFEGELTARGQLIIHSTGCVSGKIRYGKILIEEGGRISGDIQSIAAADNGSSQATLPPATTMVTKIPTAGSART
jgi:cytoskeletal protein CcmA (bactofilin family)